MSNHYFQKTLLIAFCFLAISLLYSQNDNSKIIEIKTKVRTEALDPLQGVTITITEKESGAPVFTHITPASGDVTFTLPLFKEYTMAFTKQGFPTKRIWIDANVAGKENKTKLYYNIEKLIYMYDFTSDKLEAELLNKFSYKWSYVPQEDGFQSDEKYALSVTIEVKKLSPQQKSDLAKRLKEGESPINSPTSLSKPIVPKEFEQGFDFQGSTITQLLKKNEARAEQSRLTNSIITVYSANDKVTEMNVDKKDGSFKTRLQYGYVYKVVVTSPSTVPMFMTIDARLPKDKYDLLTTVATEGIPCVDKKSVGVDTAKFRYAFDKYAYDGKKRIVRDEKYFQEFLSGTFKEYLDYKASVRNQKKDESINTQQTPTEHINYIAGKILSGDPPSTPIKNTKIILVGDRGEPLQTCTSNNSGHFVFSNILLDQSYTLKVEEGDFKTLSGKKITIINRKGNEVIFTTADGKGTFSFHLLNSDKKVFSMLAADEESRLIAGNLLALINNVSQPVANAKVQLINDKGEKLEGVITNEFGGFVFTKIPYDQNFLIELAEADPRLANVKVVITDRNGKEMNSAVCNSEGKFQFRFLKQDELKLQKMEVEEEALRMDFAGKLFQNTKNQPLANANVDLLNDKNQVVQSTKTDNSGNFKFSKAPFTEGYSLGGLGKQGKIILADKNGVVIKETQADGKVSSFKFQLLSGDRQQLTVVSIDDPWLKVAFQNSNTSNNKQTIVIPEKVYFELNNYIITNEASVILDKVVQVMKTNSKIKIEVSSHTDSQGSDEYNMELSKKRAKSAVEYMIAHGIAKERITGVGYGESKLINKCANGVECTEDEHAQNRRLEFKVMYNK